MNRFLIIGLIGFPALVVLAGLSGVFWLRTSLPDTTGTVQLTGIQSSVVIARDRDGVPHIRAETDADAYFALGYVHAQDRFWQMETMRRFGAGRLSEVMGEATLGTDKWMRALGLYRLAQDQIGTLDEPVRRALEAYARGVNGWLEHRSGLPSLEFAGFRYTPEPWRVADSLVWGKIMATRLAGNFRTEIFRSLIAKRVTPERIGELWPAYPADAPITITGSLSEHVLDGLSSLSPWPAGRPKGASNFWVLGPGKTDTGGAILANDPHLGFSAPIMWYLARLKTPTLNVAGATVPGVPFHILGTNGVIAWGVTSTEADMEDLFVEKLSADDPTRYVTADGDAAFESHRETIKVKGMADQNLIIRHSRHGPVLSDLRSDLRTLGEDGHVVALSATYLLPSDRTFGAFFYLNRAKDWQTFQHGLRRVQGPVLNFVYADVNGNIGYRTAGKVPVRAKGSGMVPSLGWRGDMDWQGFIPFDDMPSLFNPLPSLILNANNRVVGNDYPYFISHDWAARYRADRISQGLSTSGRISLKQVEALQNDVVSLMARDLLPRLLNMTVPEHEAEKTALTLLEKWDGSMARDRTEPLIFSTWVLELNKRIYADELGNLTSGYLKMRPRFLKSVLSRRTRWCDDITTEKTEDCALVVSQALRRTISRLTEQFGADPENWAWGKVHRATFTHRILTRIPLLNRLGDISIDSDGGNFTVNRGATRVNNQNAPFAHIHGPGYRAIYDMDDVANSRFMIATGQSGNPLSEHYSDLLTRWRDGKYVRLMDKARPPETRGAETLTLRPRSPVLAKSASDQG